MRIGGRERAGTRAKCRPVKLEEARQPRRVQREVVDFSGDVGSSAGERCSFPVPTWRFLSCARRECVRSCSVSSDSDWEVVALAEGVAHVGVSPSMFDLVQVSRGRAVFRSCDLGLIVRLHKPERHLASLNEVAFARWAQRSGLPVAAPDPRFAQQPVFGGWGTMTLWPLYSPVAPGDVDLEWFGATLRRLHECPAPFSSSGWRPELGIERALAALRAGGAVDQDIVDALAVQVDRARVGLAGLCRRVRDVAIHGDASLENVVADAERPLLIDFEFSGTGPGVYDLAPVQVRARRFGGSQHVADQVAAAYGIVDVDANEAMIRLHEIIVICGAIVPLAGRHVRFRDELELRVSSLDKDRAHRLWTPHLELLAQPTPATQGPSPGSPETM